VTNLEVAWVLADIAALLEIKQESVFKIRAYRKASRTIQKLPEDILKVYQENRLKEIPGIGKNISAKIAELLETGNSVYYANLKKETPEILTEMVHIPAIGIKSARAIYDNFHPETLDDLAQLAKKRKIRNLPGMGAKTEIAILRGIELLRRGSGATPLGVAKPLAEEIAAFLNTMPEVISIDVAGSVRRGKDEVSDIDLVAATNYPKKVGETFTKYPQVKEVLAEGKTKVSVRTWLGSQVDLRLVTKDQFITTLHHFTGSKEHNVRLRKLAKEKGIKINEYALLHDEERLMVKSEQDIYKTLGLQYVPPELREDQGEVEAAREKIIPELVQLSDIKGDLHLHTDWSDGVNTIREVALAAKELGYQYIAITDHSRSLKIAGGLSIEMLRKQKKEIAALNEELAPFKVFAGVEADILADGTLDYPDNILKELDLVIASIHSNFRMDKKVMTQRIIKAISNPWVHFFAHPTGRLIGRRPGYEVDIVKVMQVARDYGKALEINSSPDRLDLRDEHVFQAKEKGIPIAVNTDAHDIDRLPEMLYGIITARRGWLVADDIINTWPLDRIVKWLTE